MPNEIDSSGSEWWPGLPVGGDPGDGLFLNAQANPRWAAPAASGSGSSFESELTTYGTLNAYLSTTSHPTASTLPITTDDPPWDTPGAYLSLSSSVTVDYITYGANDYDAFMFSEGIWAVGCYVESYDTPLDRTKIGWILGESDTPHHRYQALSYVDLNGTNDYYGTSYFFVDADNVTSGCTAYAILYFGTPQTVAFLFRATRIG